MRRGLAIVLLLLAAVGASPAQAQPLSPSEVPLAEVLEVLLIDRDLVAIGARQGGQVSERLQLGESVLWLGAQGKVGVAITTRRVLAVMTGSGSWQETNYLQNEIAPPAPTLGDRVALVVTSRRALGFDGGSGNLVEYRFGPRERFYGSRVGENVAVVATDRSGLGLSPLKGGFFRVKLGAGEHLESITTGSNIGTLTTPRRVLIFRATTGTWEERNRDLR
jgi:hypothetical protein